MKFFVFLSLLLSMNAFSADKKIPGGTTAKPQNDVATQLDDLVRGELAALKAYDTVLKDVTGKEKEQLQQIRQNHQSNVNHLSKYVAGKPELLEDTESAGVWGTFVKGWTKGGKLLGNDTALKALQTGEEHGINEYQEALEDETIPKDLKAKIKDEMLPKQKQHIDTLKKFM